MPAASARRAEAGLLFRVQGSCRVQGMGFWVYVGYRNQDLGCGV